MPPESLFAIIGAILLILGIIGQGLKVEFRELKLSIAPLDRLQRFLFAIVGFILLVISILVLVQPIVTSRLPTNTPTPIADMAVTSIPTVFNTDTPNATNTIIPTAIPTLTSPIPPLTPTLTPTLASITSLLITDFDNGIDVTAFNGQMGLACPQDNCPAPNRFIAAPFEENSDHKGTLRLEYAIIDWVAFWMKLQKVDLSKYSQLQFDIRADKGLSTSREIKIEIKRGAEVGVQYFGGIVATWQTVEVNLADFKKPSYAHKISGWTNIDELVFTFESTKAGGGGIIYLDNIRFVP